MENKRMNDHLFFTSLQMYQPFLYTGHGTPWFLLNRKWHKSFLCLMASLIIYAVSIYFLHHYRHLHEPQIAPNKTLALTAINFFMLLGLLVTFLMTQFLNPGIRNIHLLDDEDFKQFGKKYCVFCEKNVLENMQHCKQCCACINHRHHHCMFFEKCIGGSVQKYAFKFFLLFAFCSCLTLFVTLILYLV